MKRSQILKAMIKNHIIEKISRYCNGESRLTVVEYEPDTKDVSLSLTCSRYEYRTDRDDYLLFIPSNDGGALKETKEWIRDLLNEKFKDALHGEELDEYYSKIYGE